MFQEKPISFVLIRTEGLKGITQLVVVSCDVMCEDDEKPTIDEAKKRIIDGVTNWMAETDAGKQAWDYAADDFNIGDLASDLDEELEQFIYNQGVNNIKIERPDIPSNWTYDTPLTAYTEDQ